MHKLILGRQPSSFDHMFSRTHGDRTKNFILEKINLPFLYQFPTATLPRIWNIINLKTKKIPYHTTFKDSLYASLASNYPVHVRCRNRGCPDCFN